jgi:hypothetical protein
VASERQHDGAPRRPIYLVIALIAMWLVGMNTAAEGLVAIQIVRDPFSSATPTLGAADPDALLRAAWMEAIAANARVTLPLGVAQLILGALLVLISARALFGRRASTSFALQVLFANAALLVVGYALRQPVRGTVVDAVVASGIEQRPAGLSPREFDELVRSKLWWTFRILLGLQLGTLALSAVALTRRAARELLAPAEPSPGEES